MKFLNVLFRLNKKGSDYLSRKIPKLFNGVDRCEILKNIIHDCLEERHGIRILEVGGTDRPLFKKMPGIVYDGLDIACRMLYDNYFVRPVEKGIPGKYDVIFSTSVL